MNCSVINELDTLHWNGYDSYIEPISGFDPPEESISNVWNLTQHSDTSIGEHTGELSKLCIC